MVCKSVCPPQDASPLFLNALLPLGEHIRKQMCHSGIES